MATEHLSDEQIDRHVLQALAMKAMGFILAILGFLGSYLFYQIFDRLDSQHERIHQLEIRVEVIEHGTTDTDNR